MTLYPALALVVALAWLASGVVVALVVGTVGHIPRCRCRDQPHKHQEAPGLTLSTPARRAASASAASGSSGQLPDDAHDGGGVRATGRILATRRCVPVDGLAPDPHLAAPDEAGAE